MRYSIKMNYSRYSSKNLILIWSSLMILATLLFAGCSTTPEKSSQPSSSHASHTASAAPTPRIPAFYDNPADAKPLPAVLDPSRFHDPTISKAYYIANLNQELFAQQPCYCYCDAGHGHRSLLDCYTSEHGAGCGLCIQEALFIDKMHKEGKSASEIRDLIVHGGWRSVKLE